MNEEIRINENEVVNEVENFVETENSTGGLYTKILIGLGVAGAGALITLAYKHKDKLDERRIRKLEKKGYTVYKADVVDDNEEELDSDLDDNETEE